MPNVLPVSSEATARICTTLHYFAPLCSDFAPRHHYLGFIPSPELCRPALQFRSRFGLVSAPRSHALTLPHSQRPPGKAPPETQTPNLGKEMVNKW